MTNKLTYAEQEMWLEKFRIAIKELDRYLKHGAKCEWSSSYVDEFLNWEIFKLLNEYCEKANAITEKESRIGWFTGSDEWQKKYGTGRDNDEKVKGIVKRTILRREEEVKELIYSFSTEERKAFLKDKILQSKYAQVVLNDFSDEDKNQLLGKKIDGS